MTDKPCIVVFSAHVTDFCSRCGGTVAKYTHDGSKAVAVCFTFGERGESGKLWREREGITVEEVKQIRKLEVAKAAEVLGVEVICLDYDDNPLVFDEARRREVVALIHRYRPSIVLSHWKHEPTNPDHDAATEAVLRCVAHAVQSSPTTGAVYPWPATYLFEPTIPRTEESRFNPDTFIDISDTFEQKLEAMRQLATQVHLMDWYIQYGQHRAWQARDVSANQDIRYAEAFVRHSPWVGNRFP